MRRKVGKGAGEWKDVPMKKGKRKTRKAERRNENNKEKLGGSSKGYRRRIEKE